MICLGLTLALAGCGAQATSKAPAEDCMDSSTESCISEAAVEETVQPETVPEETVQPLAETV